MKTGNHFISVSILVLLVASVSFNCFASTDDVKTHNATTNSSNLSHATLAKQYENLANEMLTKAQEQEEIFEHKPRTSFFGKNGQHIKSHIAYKIHQFEQAAQENFKKAAHHRAMVAKQASPTSDIQANQPNQQINKAKIKLNKDTGL